MTSTENEIQKEKLKLGPSVYSHKNIADQFVNFSIVTGEVKNLPIDYEKSTLIKNSLKVGDLVLMNKEVKNKVIEAGVTLDFKDISNFLNQNTSTVLKQLKINDLSKKDLESLMKAEKKNKQRKKIIDFIKSLEKVN